MAVVYFTSNASTGAGSLVEAVKNARPGDVIRPDETVFERGSTIEIALASTLNVAQNLTLDASPCRVRFVGGGATGLVYVRSGAAAKFVGFDFVGGVNSSTYYHGGGATITENSNAVFNRCLFAGCETSRSGGAIFIQAGSSAEVRDSVIVGCRAASTSGGLCASGVATVSGSTIIGNVDSTGVNDVGGSGKAAFVNSIIGASAAKTSSESVGSVVGVASSTVGFVASPPDDLTPENWNANLWQDWDLRLFDDASLNPSPYRDSGDVGEMSQYDLQGNFRGRKTNDVETCSPGAYETIQADLFWVGRDATGAEVVSPSFLTSNGWAASRFATVSGDVAPQNGDVVFIGGSITFDGNSLRLKKLVVGGGASLSVDNSSGATLTTISDQFDFGVGSTLRSVGSSTLRFQIGRAVLVSRFGDWVNIQPQFLLGEAAGLEIAPTAKFTMVASSVKLYANGFYTNYNLQITNVATVEGDSSGCENVYVSFQKPTARIAANGTPRVACGLVKWTTPTDATSDFTALEIGSSPIVFAPSRSATVAGNGSRDDFSLDLSNARTSGTLALTLTGQTVCGDAPTCAVSLTGSATVDERGLTSQTLTLNADAELNVDGGFVCVGELVVADGASVAFSSERGDAVLTATESATVGAASFSGTGYFATPQGTDASAATFAETIRVSDFGAGVADFTATATGPTTATLAWSATDATARVCVERESAAAPNGWETLTIAPTAEASPLEVALSGRERFRIFDGATFTVDSAWFSVEFYQCRTVSVAVASTSGGAGVVWETNEGGIMFVDGKEPKVGENCCVYAKIKSPLSGTWVPAERVANVEATVWRTGAVVETTLGAVAYRPIPARTVVPGWNGVALPTSLVLEAPILPVEPPVADETEGYNFIWTPDVGENPIFPEPGTYRIQVVFTLDDGTQIYLTEDATVKNR